MNWKGKGLEALSDLELLQAYNDCVTAEQKRTDASANDKFNIEAERNGVRIKPISFAPTNPNFLELKQTLATMIEKRGLQQ